MLGNSHLYIPRCLAALVAREAGEKKKNTHQYMSLLIMQLQYIIPVGHVTGTGSSLIHSAPKIAAEINVRPNRECTPHRKVFVFRKADWDGIKRKLNAHFEKMQENSQQPLVNELWNRFKITLLDSMREFIPQKMIKSKHCLPWVTLNIAI